MQVLAGRLWPSSSGTPAQVLRAFLIRWFSFWLLPLAFLEPLEDSRLGGSDSGHLVQEGGGLSAFQHSPGCPLCKSLIRGSYRSVYFIFSQEHMDPSYHRTQAMTWRPGDTSSQHNVEKLPVLPNQPHASSLQPQVLERILRTKILPCAKGNMVTAYAREHTVAPDITTKLVINATCESLLPFQSHAKSVPCTAGSMFLYFCV